MPRRSNKVMTTTSSSAARHRFNITAPPHHGAGYWSRYDDPFVSILKRPKEGPLGLGFVCLPSGEGIVVTLLEPGTPAYANESLSVGDVITAVNSIPLRFTEKEDAAETIGYCGDTLELTVAGSVKREAIDAILEANIARHRAVNRGRWRSTILPLLKLPFILPFLVLTFLFSILEGFMRMLIFRVLHVIRSGLEKPDIHNYFFDVMINLWYEVVLDIPVQKADNRNKEAREKMKKRAEEEMRALRSRSSRVNISDAEPFVQYVDTEV